MKLETWLKTYRPIVNTICKDTMWPVGDCENVVFHYDGAEFEQVRKSDAMYVWTLLSVDGVEIIVPGFHRVNREGYIITTEPWDNRIWDVEIYLWESEDDPSSESVQEVAHG